MSAPAERPAAFRAGQRVTVLGDPIGVTFDLRTGTIASLEDTLYAIVHLDRPALYRRADGALESLPELREAVDNLRVATATTEDELTGIERQGGSHER